MEHPVIPALPDNLNPSATAPRPTPVLVSFLLRLLFVVMDLIQQNLFGFSLSFQT